MFVTSKNQVLFEWKRCRDGYRIDHDDAGAPWLHPNSANTEPIQPLENRALFRRFADLTLDDIDEVLAFANDVGLTKAALEPDPVSVFTAAAETMKVLTAALERNDYTVLCDQFNPLLRPASFFLEPQPRNQRPVLRYRPKNLLEALWTQFALAVTRNEIQRRCVECGNWFAPINAKKMTCSNACRTAKSRGGRKSKGAIK